jgi:hypothetical protein
LSRKYPNKLLAERMARSASSQRQAEDDAKEQAERTGRRYIRPKFKDASKSHFKPSKVREIPQGMNFIMISREVLEALMSRPPSRRGFQMLIRLALEHLAHASTENGNLIVTQRQFAKEARISSDFIAPTKEELVELGWLVVEHDGQYAGGAKRDPCRYRLTCFKFKSAGATGAPVYFEPTHEWRDVKTVPKLRRPSSRRVSNVGLSTEPGPAAKRPRPSLKRRQSGHRN